MTGKTRFELACVGAFGLAVAIMVLPWWMLVVILVAALVLTHKRGPVR